MVVAVDKSVVVDKLVAVDRSVAEDKVVRCTVVGDGLVGKTGLVKKFVSGQFSPEYVATLKDDYSAQLFASGDVYNLHVTDIAGEVCTCTNYLKIFILAWFKMRLFPKKPSIFIPFICFLMSDVSCYSMRILCPCPLLTSSSSASVWLTRTRWIAWKTFGCLKFDH